MKTKRFLNFAIDYCFALSFFTVKRLTFDLPDNADDIGLSLSNTHPTIDGWVRQIRYFCNGQVHYIDLPCSKRADIVSITPMYVVHNGKKSLTTNRNIIVDIYR